MAATVKADVRFPSGEMKRCVGRVRDGQSVPWTSEADAVDHIARIRSKGYDVKIVRFVRDGVDD